MHRRRSLFVALFGMAAGFGCGRPSIPIEWATNPEATSELRSNGRTIRVPEDQPTIAAAMAAAGAGDTVKLAQGDFHELVVLKAGVSVVGSPSTIDATGMDNGILAPADATSATVESLVIKASNAQGILVQGTHGLRLRKVTLQGCGVKGAAGIRMDDAQVSIEDSEISGSGTAGIRAVTSDLALSRSQVHGNAAAGLRNDGSSSRVSDSVFANNTRGVVLAHGSVSTLERNQLSGNADTGLYVYAGDDIQDQVRSTAKSSHNIVTGSEQGLQIFNSDLSSEDDRFDGNGDGVIAGYGASMSAVRLSASDNRRIGI